MSKVEFEHVEICPDGLFYYKWNGEKRKFIRRRVKKSKAVSYLRQPCKIIAGTTLGQFFEVIDKYKLLKLVISQYSWCHAIEEFHAQAKEPMRGEESNVDYLEVYWHAEVESFTEKIKHPGGLREKIKSADFELSADFHGIGKSDENGFQQYSVSYSPMYDLADLPIILNEKFDVYEPWENKHNKDNLPQKILESKRNFTFLQVLDGIYWDISFMGGPQDNLEFLEDLDDRMEAVNSGEIPLIPLDKIIGNKDDDDDPNKMQILLHPDVARILGVDPNSIPLDDKEFIKKDEDEELDL